MPLSSDNDGIGIGGTLMAFVRDRSAELGFEGRVGRHAGLETEAFDRRQGMPDDGPDPDQEGLVDFEYGILPPGVVRHMDEKRSTQPVKRHSDLMAQLNDPAWLKQNAAIEGNGYVAAGNGGQGYIERLQAVTPEAFREQKRQVRALSMLLPVLRDWIAPWELGASSEVVYIEAQSILFQHIQQASTEQESWIEELITPHEQGTRAESPQAQLHLRQRLAAILTQDNWHALATITAQDMEKQVLKRAQAHVESTSTV